MIYTNDTVDLEEKIMDGLKIQILTFSYIYYIITFIFEEKILLQIDNNLSS